ncbi:YoaK family protein [Croceicoccus naphthovorans]|uniref:Uncharacterized protein n=1 Tax=Croceicoccus naphthovorans TaxID=1348774 RepID=A0A0G3XG23_9SPHN|nr:DUF1275 family protein [Croceicoccus naphthovorans]AKM09566.1 hypothetical protein AB433_05590 [Croceicoccus naphthovorans]MBB3989667.1 uncharacterized membrane protein YoaK (UPF0700 family) [Croceicoccus naphthovorans]
MRHIGTDRQALAIAIAVLAGYVDAIGYVASGGFFVSFMSGNSTRLGVGLARAPFAAMLAGGLILSFLAGVIACSTMRMRWRFGAGAVMTGVALLIAVAAGTAPFVRPYFVLLPVAAAMGMVNLVFETEGEVRFGLTYMTGTLVKLGQGIARALTGADRMGWLPFLLLWAGLVVGGVAGVFAWLGLGPLALWIAAGWAAALCWPLARMERV